MSYSHWYVKYLQKSKEMNTKIINIKDAKFAFVDNNRKVSKNQSLIDSIDKLGVLQPIIAISANDIEEELTLYAADTTYRILNKEEQKDYLVVLDGQHRINFAYQLLEKKRLEKNDGIFELPISVISKEELKGMTINEYIIALNSTQKQWENSDYIDNSYKIKNQDFLVRTIKAFSDKGFPMSSISRFICLDKQRLNKDTLTAYTNNKAEEIKYANPERAIRLYLYLRGKGFSNSFLSKRYLIDYIISEKTQHEDINKVLNKIEYLRHACDINQLKFDQISNMENIIEEDFRNVMLEADNDLQRDKILSNKDFLSAISEEEIDSFFRNKNKVKNKKDMRPQQKSNTTHINEKEIPLPSITESRITAIGNKE